MKNELNASGYYCAKIIYEKELQRILQGIYLCYTMMIKDNIKLSNNENEIRDKLLIDYLKNNRIRDITGLTGNYIFNREVPEDKSKGRTDIRIETLMSFYECEAYYIIECKRLNNKKTRHQTGLNAHYIKNGIYRFVSNYYSTHNGVNAMLGFVVEKTDINENISNINYLLQKYFSNCNTINCLSIQHLISDFEFLYKSEHQDKDNKTIRLYHLMLDFSNNISYDNS